MHSSRLFVALWPDVVTRDAIAALQRQVMLSSGRTEGAVAYDNLHLTLAFLGEVARSDADALQARLASVSFLPFHLELDRWGHFTRPGILWLGCQAAPEELYALQADVGRACKGFGQARRERDWTPHVSLFRKLHRLPEVAAFESVEWLIDRIVLVASDTRPEGVRYRVIHEVFA